MILAIIEQIQQGESDHLEFKSSFQKEVIESVVAFANAKGGMEVIGIDDKQQILGVNLGAEPLNDWQNQIKNSTYPQTIPDIDVIDIEGKQLVLIRIQEQPIKPIAYKQRYFKRIRNSNHLISLDEIANENLKRLNASWDYYIDTRHDFNDISQDKIVSLIKRIERYQHKQFDDDLFGILRKYELIKDGKLTWAAYLLFVGNFSAITPLQIGRFKSILALLISPLTCQLRLTPRLILSAST